jgi:hypothetical protein
MRDLQRNSLISCIKYKRGWSTQEETLEKLLAPVSGKNNFPRVAAPAIPKIGQDCAPITARRSHPHWSPSKVTALATLSGKLNNTIPGRSAGPSSDHPYCMHSCWLTDHCRQDNDFDGGVLGTRPNSRRTLSCSIRQSVMHAPVLTYVNNLLAGKCRRRRC